MSKKSDDNGATTPGNRRGVVMMQPSAPLKKGRRILGAERRTLAKDLVKRYSDGESIRELASSTGRSYGFIQRVLTESGVELRRRGWSKLTEDNVRKIKRLLRDGRSRRRDLATEYNVHLMTISNIATGRTWRNVTEGKRQPRIGRHKKDPRPVRGPGVFP